ncbi:MAG TPA: tRNA (adenosine(37)-N6)-threonylcarbamoyltransferase complex transferase subunit TsaD [Gemmatimonadales bacterium]|nr:tRNA (adenosine(37)-N6)-threonylcarbamoyltransferase complex transferase subunit TsaD [Gemmatimonadales bacterium]
MRVLGIETSCDETSAAVVAGDGDGARVASCVILSQDVHAVYRGVVPELASRAHLVAIGPVVTHALVGAGIGLGDVDLIAVTEGPGLIGALLVGVSYAKGLGLAAGRPLVGVHHLEAHLFGTALDDPAALPPFVGLIVSGGHSLLLDVPAWGDYRLLGETRDDAVGEAFDKVAALLELGYPGGPAVEKAAREGDPARHRFPRPMLNARQRPGDGDYYDLSMSGLKTAMIHAVKASTDLAADRPHLARGFQDAVIEVLVTKTLRAVEQCGRRRVVLGGGVACNRALREAMAAALLARGATLHAPSPRLSTDNAAMIARAGLFRAAEAGRPVDAAARLPFPGLVRA